MKNIFKKVALSAIVGAAMAQGASAATLTLNFDNAASGSDVNLSVPAAIRFYNAALLPDQDEWGDDIPGSEKWQIDPSVSDPVVVLNPSTVDYGSAPSGTNALDARWSPLLMHFDSAIELTGFSVTLDNSTFGTIGMQELVFLGANKSVLGILGLDQTQPGYVGSWTGTLAGVQEILLPSGAFYDNLTITSTSPVPVPAALPLLLSAFAALGALRIRRPA